MPITNFEELTAELTPEEKLLLPVLIEGFKTKTKQNPVKAPDIVKSINARREKYGLQKKFTEVRLRKLCNYIRTNKLLPLMATSDGYYVSYDRQEISSQVQSLEQRANAIYSAASGLRAFL